MKFLLVYLYLDQVAVVHLCNLQEHIQCLWHGDLEALLHQLYIVHKNHLLYIKFASYWVTSAQPSFFDYTTQESFYV